MLTTKLNYQRIMALNPTVYCTITNSIGQTFDLVEHPTKGDEYTVIIMYHAEKLAVDSEFWDTADMESGGDYMPVYMYGDMHLAYELDEADLIPSDIEKLQIDTVKYYKIQSEQLAVWKTKLNKDCFSASSTFIVNSNNAVTHPDQIKRGVYL
jgi:hypothetical protein